MTDHDTSITAVGGPGAHGRDTSGFSDVSFTSTLTDDQEADASGPKLDERSTIKLLPSHANGHRDDPGQYKSESSLSTIEETTTAASSPYVHSDPLRSTANGHRRDSGGYNQGGHSGIYTPDVVEPMYSPSTTYPPISEEDSEAKRVEQNLERWAAEERQRRKAQRTSKILANRNPTTAVGGLAHRLSILRTGGYNANNNNLGAGPSSERLADGPGASPSMPYNPSLSDRSRDSANRRTSAISSTGIARGLRRSSSSSSIDSSHSHGSLVSDDRHPNRKLPPIGSRVSSAIHEQDASNASAKSNGHVRDPFRDPSDGGDLHTDLGRKRSSLKPTPTAARPIVTVGRASSIQRRALEANYKSKGKGKGKGRSMPTIVATDTEAEAEADSSLPGDNPFSSAQDRQRPSGSTTIHQGGLDEEVAMELAGKRNGAFEGNGDLGESPLDAEAVLRPPPRTSTSSSKFRELGITEGDDWMDTVGADMGKTRSRTMRIGQHSNPEDEPDGLRKPWWTELLCGCSRDLDDDEQAGRTNPME